MAHKKILVADDEPYVLNVCQRVLSESYEVKIARSGMEAVQMARQEPFDLLLTDIKMPGIDGLETAREIRKIQPQIKCITMTAFSTMETALKALRLGIDEFVLKPFAPEELTLTIERVFEKVHLREENIRLKSLLPLFELNKTLFNHTDSALLLKEVINLALKETRSDFGLAILPELSVSSKRAQFSGNLDQFIADMQDVFLKSPDYHSEQIFVENRTTNKYRKLISNLPIQCVLTTPITDQKETVGLLVMVKADACFSRTEQEFLNVLAGQAGAGLKNAQLIIGLQKAYDDLRTKKTEAQSLTNVALAE